MAGGGGFGAPAGLDDRGLVVLGDDGGAGDRVARAQIGAAVEWSRLPGAGGEEPNLLERPQWPRARWEIRIRRGDDLARRPRLDRDRLDDDRPPLDQKREPAPVGVLERGAHRPPI